MLIPQFMVYAQLAGLPVYYGLNTISAGNLCSFAIEAAGRKKIDYEIDYGEVDAIARLLEEIAHRKGIGNVLAEGIRFAAKSWDLEDLAIHVKGLEPAGYDPKVLKGSAWVMRFQIGARVICAGHFTNRSFPE